MEVYRVARSESHAHNSTDNAWILKHVVDVSGEQRPGGTGCGHRAPRRLHGGRRGDGRCDRSGHGPCESNAQPSQRPGFARHPDRTGGRAAAGSARTARSRTRGHAHAVWAGAAGDPPGGAVVRRVRARVPPGVRSRADQVRRPRRAQRARVRCRRLARRRRQRRRRRDAARRARRASGAGGRAFGGAVPVDERDQRDHACCSRHRTVGRRVPRQERSAAQPRSRSRQHGRVLRRPGAAARSAIDFSRITTQGTSRPPYAAPRP